LQSFEKFLVSSRASLVYSNGSEPSHYATSNLFQISSSGQEKCFQVDFDYIYDSEGLSVDIFSPHKAVTKTKGK